MPLTEFNHFFQESILSDLKNGVNPQSKKRVFHITRDNMYDPNDLIPDDMIFKTFKPRVPSFAANTKGSSGFASSSDGKYKEDGITPRICVSPSIEGCLNSLRSYLSNSDNPRRVKQEFNKGVWYVYTPLQDLSKYNIKSNLDIVKNGLVWDAKYTKETWILEDTTMVLYGIIKVDDVSDPMTKQNSDIRKPGTYRLRENMEGRFSFSWHWVKSNEALMRDKRIADIIKNAREKQSNDKTFKPDIPKTGKRKQDEIDRDKRIASTKEYNAKSASYGKQIRDFNTKLSKMIDDINSGKSGISEKEFRVFWDSGKKLRKEWKKFLEEEDDTADMFPDEQLNLWLNIIKKNKSKPTTESYIDDDTTSGTSEFDESYDNDPNDCYCESSIFTTGDFSQYGKDVNLDSARGPIMNIRMRPATEDDTENMYNWEIESIHPDLRTRSDVQELIRKDVDQSIKDTLMIMDGDKTIGMFTACMIDDGEWRYIGEIYLIPEYRGKGIGTTILKNEINNYDRIRLKVATTNDRAIKLYKSLGFEIIKEVDGQMYIMEYDKTKSTSISDGNIIRTNAVYLKGGEITKIENFKFNKVYFGSPNKIPSTMKLDGPLFVSPYPGIASIFAVRPQNLRKYGVKPGERINRDYDEWNHSLIDSVLQKPLTELHVKIVGAPYIKPTTELVSGYLYEIEVTPDIKRHIYQSQKMDKTFEYCIDKLDTIDFSNIKKVNIRMTVEGVANNMVQEAKLPSKKRKALDDSEFALVYTDANGKKIRKYPIYDKAHCKAAARMFPRGVPLKYQSKVARKILRRAHKFGIDTSGWKNLNKFKESD